MFLSSALQFSAAFALLQSAEAFALALAAGVLLAVCVFAHNPVIGCDFQPGDAYCVFGAAPSYSRPEVTDTATDI